MRTIWSLLAAAVLLAILLFATSGRFLVVNDPRAADLIVVLAGDTDRRPARGLELQRAGQAPELLLDVPANAMVFNVPVVSIAQDYVNALPEHDHIHLCPIFGLSTKAETHDVARCMANKAANRILIVTSDYHTRRALNTFRHELPNHEFSVAAATDPTQFGGQWWKQRQWAKTNFEEWLKLIWWQTVDRWRR
jgi:uncharacterized SAM-binding protein YcdF (DUF218 family)